MACTTTRTADSRTVQTPVREPVGTQDHPISPDREVSQVGPPSASTEEAHGSESEDLIDAESVLSDDEGIKEAGSASADPSLSKQDEALSDGDDCRKVLCNGHNFLLLETLAYRFTPSFGSMYEGRTCILGRGVLVLVG
jgi:hypothetical protein